MNSKKDNPAPSLAPATPKLFGPLRPEPASLFNRASVTTVALVNAIVLAGSVDAQAAESTKAATSGTNQKAAPSGAETAEVTLSEVVVAAQPDSYKTEFLESPKYTAPILDTPQTVNVITKELIKDQNATTLREVLRNVTGISAQAGEGGVPNGDILTIRGFNARTDMFVDGIRDMGGYTRDPFNYEQVEVAKGPSSAYSGRGSTGGSINLVSKTPNLKRSYAGSVGIGNEQSLRTTLDLNQPIEALPGTALRVNALWQEGDVAGRDFVSNQRWAIAPSVAFGLGTENRLTLSYFHMEQKNTPDNGIPWVPDTNVPLAGNIYQAPPGVGFNTWYGLANRDYERVKTDLVTLEAEKDINENLTIRNIFRYGRNERDSIYTTPRFLTSKIKDPADPSKEITITGTDINREFKSHMRVTEIIADTISARAKFDTWKFSHTVDGGFEFAHERENNRARATLAGPNGPITTVDNPDAQDKPFPYAVGSDGKLWTGPFTGASTTTTSNSYGIFLFDTIKLHEKLELNAGVRWDRFEADSQNVAVRGSTTTVTDPITKVKTTTKNKSVYLSRTDEAVTYRIGPVFKPVPNGSIYIGYGTSFNPSAEGLAVTVAANNIDVKPEESHSFEIGTKWDFFDKRLMLQGSIFRIEKTNARTPNLDPNDPAVVLEGEQRVDGLELGASGSITEHWKVFTGFTYLNSQYVKSNTEAEIGRRLPGTPQTSFNFWTTYELPWNITIGGGGQYVGSRFADATNLRKAPDYWTFDAMVGYKINANLNAQFNISNLADEKYIDRTQGGHFIPGVGRTAMFTLNFNF